MIEHADTIVILSGSWPDKSKGYSIANLATLDFFSRHFKKCIYIGPSDEKVDNKVRKKYKNVEFISFSFDRKPRSIRFLKSLFSKFPAITERFWRAPDKIEQEIRRHCPNSSKETLFFYEDIPSAYFMFYFKKQFPTSKHIVRSHNVVYKGFQGLKVDRNPFITFFWQIELKKIKIYEKKLYDKSDQFYAISKDDSEYYRDQMNIDPDGIIGFFLDFEPYKGLEKKESNIIYFGSADLRKGRALSNFIKSAWPVIRKECPDVNLLLGGRGTEKYHNPSNRVYGYGFVESDIEFLQMGSLFINPQMAGAGIKIKSLVALASSKLLVTTKIGAEGTGLLNGVHCIIDDDFDKQAEIIIRYMKGKDDYSQIIQSGKDFVFDRYSKHRFHQKMQKIFFPES